jgi:hypothetical protein
VPFAFLLAGTYRLIDTVGGTDWGRLWGAALISFGTLLSTFAVSLTNHLPAAACAAWSGWFMLRALGTGTAPTFAAAGGLAAFTAAFELPALAWCAAVLGLLFLADRRRLLTAALPAAAIVAGAALGANWVAHGSLFPPYAHRAGVGRPGAVADRPPEATGTSSANPDNWYDYSLALSNGKQLVSYWRDPKGVDRGEPSATTYAWHSIVGHHGILSLTPAWLLLPAGLAMMMSRRRRWAPGHVSLALAIVSVTFVVIIFYLSRSQIDRNYGGVSSGFRWVFWLAPLWTVGAVPAADRLSVSRAGRLLGLALLALSVLSVTYPSWNPWSPPWIELWMRHGGFLPPA